MESPRKIFSKIYDKHIDKIYRFVFFKVNSQEIAEDLTSETFLRTWKSFKEKNQEIKNIQAFLYKTAINLVTDHYRQKGKAQIVSANNPSIADPRQDLEKRARLNSDIDNIRQALSNLKEDYQNVIIWRYLDGFTISEVANLLDRTEEATRVLLHRALKALRNNIKEV
ncbi:MAG: RNA polymerase sigma factor [Candidatus Aminicenantia bacterium]